MDLINAVEAAGGGGGRSWHDDYNHSAYIFVGACVPPPLPVMVSSHVRCVMHIEHLIAHTGSCACAGSPDVTACGWCADLLLVACTYPPTLRIDMSVWMQVVLITGSRKAMLLPSFLNTASR